MIKRWLACLLAVCLLGSSVSVWAAPDTQTKEEKESMLTFTVGGTLMQVRVIDADILRVQAFPGGEEIAKTLDTYTVDYDKSFNDYTVVEADGLLTVTTEKLRVTVEKATGKVTYYTAAGELILAEQGRTAKTVRLDNGGSSYEVAQSFASDANEALYGFGNINSTMGIKGKNISVRQTNTEKRTPMFYSNMGYGILFDIVSNGDLTWSNGNGTYTYTGRASQVMDYFFFYGPDADDVIAGYRTVTGQATMLPKNAFGYVQSRNRYGSQQELKTILNTFREKQIPLDGLVIDYHWWQGEFGDITHWGSSWGDPAAMMQYLHDNHVTCSISVWPSFKKSTDAYSRMNAIGGVLPTESGFGNFYDPSSDAARALYWQMIEENIYSKGLDSIWLDACEPEYSNWASNSASEPTVFGGNSKPIGAMYPLLTNKGVYEGQRAMAGNQKRVNSLSRGAVAGIQRYGAQSWSGDIPSTWASLAAEVSGLVNFSAAGLPYFGTDIGGYHGFNGSDPDAREMYLRWLQLGTFMTIMRSHGAGNAREPWQFGTAYESYITDCINLRERMIPYIYSLAGAVTQEDYTIIRPLIFDFRTDDNVKNIADQYMFGPALMVCPVTSSGQRSRDVYLPAGNWINFWTGETIVSTGETVRVAAPLKQIPLFVRGGSIVPMGPENQYVDESQDPTEIRVYTGADGSFTLYEDEGVNYDYENGEFSTIPFTYNEATKTLTVGDRVGSFDGMLENRTFNVVFVQPGYGIGEEISSAYQPTATLAYDGSEQSVTFDPAWEIPTPPLDTEMLPVPVSAPTAKASDNAMVGNWTFWEGEGAKVSDTSGYFNNGGLNKPDWTTAGKSGNAIAFSGGSAAEAGTCVSVASSQSLNMSEQISGNLWVINQCAGWGNMINKGGNGNHNPGYSFIVNGGGTLQLEIQSAGAKTTAVSASGVPKDGQWHQVGFTWKSEAAGGDGIVRLYVDGVQTSDDSRAGNYFAGPIGANDYPLIIGRSCENEPNYPNYFQGTIDEVSLYNYALTAEEMAALYNGESILVDNVSDAAVDTAPGGVIVSWTDAADTHQVRVTVETAEPEYSMDPVSINTTVEKGVGTVTVDGLPNDEYVAVQIVSVDAQGKTSSGVNLVARPGAYPAAIDPDYVVTHGEQLFAWVENVRTTPVSGTLTITLTEGGEVKETQQKALEIAGNDRLQLTETLQTAYAPNQKLTFTYQDAQGKPLAQEITVDRGAYYTERPAVDKSQLRIALKSTVNPDDYTPESYAPYEVAYRRAKIVEHDVKATQEQVNEATAALKEARRGLKRLSSDNILMHFERSEGTTSQLLYGSMFYIDWKAANDVPGAHSSDPGVDLSGDADNGTDSNLHLKASVIFSTTDDKIDPATIWTELRFRLRSSFDGNDEKSSDFYRVRPAQLDSPDAFMVDIPLSAIATSKIDWSDVKELIVQCDVVPDLRLSATGESTVCSLTLEDVWIEGVKSEPGPDQPPVEKPDITGKNLITGKRIEVDSSDGFGGPGNINDNDRASFWDGGQNHFPHHLKVDLKDTYVLEKIEMLLPSTWNNDRHQEMEILMSDDGVNYTTIVEKTSYFFSKNENDNTVIVNLPDGAQGRYLQIIGYTNDEIGNPGMQLGELRAFGRYPDEPVDKTALNAAIEAAQAVDLTGYTDESAAALTAALEAAQAVAQDDAATQDAVDAALEALQAAQEGLTEQPPVEDVIPGDVNDDKEVTAADALMALQAATGKITLTERQRQAADVDGNEGVSAADALLILQKATGKINEF
ncbi:MAG: TIM-barrel domain-containing protein [Acutalibacteraceae bacterium]|jgi:alpha-D-xyloside xylohydrolase